MTGVIWKLHTGFYICHIFFPWVKKKSFFIKSFLVKSTERPSLPQRQAWEKLKSISKRKISRFLGKYVILKLNDTWGYQSAWLIDMFLMGQVGHVTLILSFHQWKAYKCYNFPRWQVYFYFVAAINKSLWVEEGTHFSSAELHYVLKWSHLILENYMLAWTSIFYFC